MKVVHIITSLKVGGAESSLCNLLSGLDGEHCVIYFHTGPNLNRLNGLNIPLYHVKGIFSYYDPIGFIRLLWLVKRLKPDLIHSALWSANVLGSLVTKLLRIPIVCDLHGDVSDHGWFRNVIERRILNIPKAFIAVSGSVAKSFKIVMSKDAIVIPNGIDINRKGCPLNRKDFGINDHDFVVGSIGRLVSIKSYDVLIRAFALLDHEKHSFRLCLVGDGPERENLEGLSQQLGLEGKILFMGKQFNSAGFYSLFSCFVLSSKSEGMSIALLEAMGFGVPAITTHKGFHDVIVHEKTGLLVDVGDVWAISKAINKLYMFPAFSNRIKNNAKELIKSSFSIQKMADNYKCLYKNAIKNKMVF